MRRMSYWNKIVLNMSYKTYQDVWDERKAKKKRPKVPKRKRRVNKKKVQEIRKRMDKKRLDFCKKI